MRQPITVPSAAAPMCKPLAESGVPRKASLTTAARKLPSAMPNSASAGKCWPDSTRAHAVAMFRASSPRSSVRCVPLPTPLHARFLDVSRVNAAVIEACPEGKLSRSVALGRCRSMLDFSCCVARAVTAAALMPTA